MEVWPTHARSDFDLPSSTQIRSFWPQKVAERERNGVVRTLSALPFQSRRWRLAIRLAQVPIPTRFLTADDVPESKEESHEVAGKGKSLRLRNRPRSHEGSGGRRTNVVEVRTRKITFPFSLRGLLSNRDWKEIQCRLPPAACRRDGRLSLSPPVSAAQLRATRRSSTACALCHRRDASVLLEMEDL